MGLRIGRYLIALLQVVQSDVSAYLCRLIHAQIQICISYSLFLGQAIVGCHPHIPPAIESFQNMTMPLRPSDTQLCLQGQNHMIMPVFGEG
jgi:hypothetical protein